MNQIKRRSVLSLASMAAGTSLLAHKAHAAHDSASMAQKAGTASLMVETANRFLASLNPGQRSKCGFQFGDAERLNWHFIPKERKGLPLREMTSYQKHLASALLSAGLSQTGYIKAVTIMSLEDVLKVLEKASDEYRNPEKYYFTIFGTPSATDSWGYRVEGHHLSQNYTVAGGNVTDGPSFFGSNPAEVREGPRKGLRTLAGEEDSGFNLIQKLDDSQRKIAIVDPTAYKDILTMASRKAALKGQPSGLLAAKMNPKQFDALMAVVDEYVSNMPEEVARRRKGQVDAAGKNIHFAWSGGINHGDLHYYRVQTNSFLIELDNTQNGANHIHSVWRDLEGDFGQDLLTLHYETGHHKKA
jgi:hypothetical protein